MSTAKHCTIRLDDAGSTPGANAAILKILRQGLVPNASVMMPCAWAEAFLAEAKGLSHACLGLHLTMNNEWIEPAWGPLLDEQAVPSLHSTTGRFAKDGNVHVVDGATTADLMKEAEAQLQAMRGFGVEPDYVDSHMGFEWAFEGGVEAIKDWCQKIGIPWCDDLPVAKTSDRYGPGVNHDLDAMLDALPTQGPPPLVFYHPAESSDPVAAGLTIRDQDEQADASWHGQTRQDDVDFLTGKTLREAIEDGRLVVHRVPDALQRL
ncbi:MAG: ChbG/HpnK family deacetylase [Planctomycetota bacterium]